MQLQDVVENIVNKRAMMALNRSPESFDQINPFSRQEP